MRKLAARETMNKLAIAPGSNWVTAKPLIEANLKKAAELSQPEEVEVVMYLKRLAASGVKIGDGSPTAITKEAQGFMGWMGQQMNNAGQWMANKGKGIQDNAKNAPLTKAKQSVDAAIENLNKSIAELGKIDPAMAQQFQQTVNGPLGQIRETTQARNDLHGVGQEGKPNAAPQQGVAAAQGDLSLQPSNVQGQDDLALQPNGNEQKAPAQTQQQMIQQRQNAVPNPNETLVNQGKMPFIPKSPGRPAPSQPQTPLNSQQPQKAPVAQPQQTPLGSQRPHVNKKPKGLRDKSHMGV